MLWGKWQYNLLFISCIYIHWNLRLHRDVTKTYEYWPFLLIKIGVHVLCCIWYSILQIYIKGKSDKKCSTWSWLMRVGHVFFQPNVGGGSPKFCATTRGWVMFFISSGPLPPCTFWPAPNLYENPARYVCMYIFIYSYIVLGENFTYPSGFEVFTTGTLYDLNYL